MISLSTPFLASSTEMSAKQYLIVGRMSWWSSKSCAKPVSLWILFVWSFALLNLKKMLKTGVASKITQFKL